jgi:hypothetical protein
VIAGIGMIDNSPVSPVWSRSYTHSSGLIQRDPRAGSLNSKDCTGLEQEVHHGVSHVGCIGSGVKYMTHCFFPVS